MKKTEIRRMVAAATAACEEKKAEQIHILELDPADSGFTDYFLICSGTNDRQNQAIATAVQERIKREFGSTPNSVEGYRQGEWILIDYVDFVVHIFSNEKREFYAIERLRKTATSLGLDQLKASLATKVAEVRKKRLETKSSGKATAKKLPVKKKAVKKQPAKTSTKKATAKKPLAKKALKGRAKKVPTKHPKK